MGLYVSLKIVIATFPGNAIYETAFTHQQTAWGFVSVVMRSRWLKGSGMDGIGGKKEKKRERERKRDVEEEVLEIHGKARMADGRSVLTCILYAVCCEFTALNYPPPLPRRLPSRHVLYTLSHPIPRRSSPLPSPTPLAWLCTPGTRLTHKLTLCPLFIPAEILRNAVRARENPGVINLQVNSARRDYHCYRNLAN